jgi:two-component system, NtrC family, sensor kinase
MAFADSAATLHETGGNYPLDTEPRIAELERRLQKAEERYRHLWSTGSSGMAILGTDGRVEEVNAVAATILGRQPDDILGREFRELVAPEDVGRLRAEFTLRLRGDLARRQMELQVLRPSGERRLVQVCSSGILDERRLCGVLFSARDMTEERAQEAQLRRAERLASVAPLLSGVCHELNNPLTSIKSFAELLLLDERPAEDVEALEIVQREAARAARILGDLRLVARQTQEESGNTSALCINELVREACRTVAGACAHSGIDVRVELAPQLPTLYGDGAQLERAIKELLANAVNALKGQTGPRQLRIRTFACERGAGLRVEDTGPGIEPQHLDRIFDPFWTTRTTGEGTGLGLSLVHSIVTDHRGSIRVEGGWREGAAFTVEFPAPAEFCMPAGGGDGRTAARRPLRILVADDEGPIRFTLMRYMERRGHLVREAEEGARALAMLDDEGEAGFDVIVADLRMPNLGGEQLYERLRERADGMERRVVFITGDAESPDAARLLVDAGVPVVLKPFELAEIAQIIEAHADLIG